MPRRNGRHIIERASRGTVSSTSRIMSPLRNEISKADRKGSRSEGGRSSADTASNLAPFRSKDSSVLKYLRTKDRSRSEARTTTTGRESIGERERVSCRDVPNVFQFLNILNPSLDDMIFLGCLRDYGFSTAIFFAKRFGWKCEDIISSIRRIFLGRGIPRPSASSGSE